LSSAWRARATAGGATSPTTAPGIPVDERATLFQKFNRGTNTPATGEAGSGLGLFIAATLMQAMNGQVDHLAVDSRGSPVSDNVRPA
jgi:K+-sensing histidine kinase KdpD